MTRFLRRIAAPAFAGLCVAASMPPWGWWPLAFLGIAVLDQSLVRPRSQDWRSRFTAGWFFGAFWLFPATLWMWDLSAPGYVVAGILFGVYYGVGMAILPSGPVSRRVALVAVLVIAGVARWSWPFGGVPLATLAMSQANGPLAPTVRTFGTLTLVALVAICGVALSAAWSQRWAFVGGSVAALVGVAALTAVAPTGSPIGSLDIAIVQGGGPQNTRAIFTSSAAVFDRHVEATRLVAQPVDLIIWPENVVAVQGLFADSEEFETIQNLAEEMGAPIIPGITEGWWGDDPYFTNASLAVYPDGRLSEERYDKVRIVPFGEYVPLRWLIEPLAPDYLPARDARAGSGPAAVATDVGTLGISISWEIFFDTRARDAVQNGGTILINPTNGSSYWLTIVQSQQVASSQLRAMETGRWVLQAAPTGFSAIVTPDGEVIDRSGVSEQKVIQGTVELRTGHTWAVRWGRWPMLLTALAALALSHAGAWFAKPTEEPELEPQPKPSPQ